MTQFKTPQKAFSFADETAKNCSTNTIVRRPDTSAEEIVPFFFPRLFASDSSKKKILKKRPLTLIQSPKVPLVSNYALPNGSFLDNASQINNNDAFNLNRVTALASSLTATSINYLGIVSSSFSSILSSLIEPSVLVVGRRWFEFFFLMTSNYNTASFPILQWNVGSLISRLITTQSKWDLSESAKR